MVSRQQQVKQVVEKHKRSENVTKVLKLIELNR